MIFCLHTKRFAHTALDQLSISEVSLNKDVNTMLIALRQLVERVVGLTEGLARITS